MLTLAIQSWYDLLCLLLCKKSINSSYFSAEKHTFLDAYLPDIQQFALRNLKQKIHNHRKRNE